MAERSPVKRLVPGSSPGWGANNNLDAPWATHLARVIVHQG